MIGMTQLLRDLRFALRMIARSPSYAAVAALTLGLAIGAGTSIYSMVDAVLLHALPYRDAGALVSIWERLPQFPEMSVCYSDYLDWKKAQRSFTALAAMRAESFNLTGVDRPERLEGRMISAELLPLLGVEPALGRNFLPEEDRPGGAPVLLLTYGFWQRRFGGDREIVGRTLGLNGRPHRVVGVLPANFRSVYRWAGAPLGTVYVPIGQLDPQIAQRGNHPGISVTGRLRPGVSLAQARAEMEGIGREIGRQNPTTNAAVLPALVSLEEDMFQKERPMILLLLGAVGFVILIAVANVANLALARGTIRRKEMAIRSALGAGRWALLRQLLLESVLLALLGGGLGVLLSLWGVDAIVALQKNTRLAEGGIELNQRVLGFSLGLATLTGLLSGLVPALSFSRVSVHEALKDGDLRATPGVGHGRLRAALVVSEMALSLMLLVGAGLSIQGFVRLLQTDPGYRAEGLVTMQLTVPSGRYDGETLRRLFGQVDAQVRELPGVQASTISCGLPLAGASESSFWVDGRPQPLPAEKPTAVNYPVSANFHKTMGIPILMGRGFTEQDREGQPDVALIDERLAQTFFPGQSPLGRHLLLGDGKRPWEIVGVTRHIAHYGIGTPEAAPYQFYLPYRQLPEATFKIFGSSINISIRTGLPPAAVAQAVAAVVARIDRDQPIYEVHLMGELIDDAMADRRFAMLVLGLFAALALVLAVVGLYAVMAYTVTQRTHEIGVRMALGAQPQQVRRMVLRQGLRLAGLGLAAGTVGALLLARGMSAVVAAVDGPEPAILGGVAAALLGVAALACLIPARRATRVDPMIALRGE